MKYAVFDIDGVLADFEGYLVQSLEAEFGMDARMNRHKYSLRERFGSRPDIDVRAYTLANDPRTYKHLNWDFGAVALLFEVKEQGYDVAIATSRKDHNDMRRVTEMWLGRVLHGVNFDLLFCPDGKAPVLAEVKDHIAFVIDDNPEEIKAMKSAGIENVFAWKQPWNEDVYPRINPDKHNEPYVQIFPGADENYFWDWLKALEER